MTNPNQQPPNQNDNENIGIFSQISQVFQQPRTQVITGITVISLGIAGYMGVRILVNQVIPTELEKILSDTLEREVELGEISSFSLNHITVKGTSIPPTDDDNSYAEIDKININFDLFPLIINRTLPIDIVVNKATVFAQIDTLIKQFQPKEEEEEAKPFEWPDIPVITPEINLQLKQADLTVQMASDTQPLMIDAKGDVNLVYDKHNKPLEYNLKANLAEGKVEIEGETILETIESNNQVIIENLYLPEIASSLESLLPVTLNEGEVNANLTLDIPSLEDIENFDVNGNLRVENIQANLVDSQNIKALEKPIYANALLDFQGQKVTFQEAKANIGDVGGNIEGSVDYEDGFNLNLNLNPLRISKLLPQIPVTLPVNADGFVSANIQVNGDVLNPVIEGNIQSKKTLVDKIALGDINTNFQANLEEFVLEKLTVKPVAGGEFVANGVIKTNLKETITNKGKIDITKMPLNFKFQTNLPTEKIISPYNIIPNEISIGNLSAKGQLTGNLNKPLASAEFTIPQASSATDGQISGQGKLVLDNQKFKLINTELIADQGKINVEANGDFKSQKWQANLIANQLYLTPFLAQFCRTSSSCPNDQIDLSTPITVTNTNVELNGNLDNISLDTIQAEADVDLKIDRGSVLVNSTLNEGQIQATAKARQIPVTDIVTAIPLNTNLVSSDINVSTTVDDLLTLASSPEKIPSNFNIVADTKLAVESGIVDAITNVNSQQTKVIANVNNVSLEKVLPSLDTEIESTQVNLSAKTQELLALAKQPFNFNNFNTLNSLNANADLQLKVGTGNVNANANINSDFVTATAITTNISPQEIIPNLPIDADNVNAQVNLKADFSDVLAFGNNYLETQTVTNIPSLNLTTDANLEVAEGRVSALVNAKNNQWQAKINTDEVNPESLAKQLALIPNNEDLNIGNLNSQINLAGNVDSLLQPNQNIPIQAKSIKVNLGENNIAAEGNLTISNLLTKPDVSNLQINVNAASNLASLPINPILKQFNTDNVILPEEINLEGQAEFQGNIKGKNLLSNPLGKDNLNVNGNLKLANFSLNNFEFEPLLEGKVTIIPDQEIAINLRGENDAVVAKIVPGNLTIPNTNLTIPYVPDNIEIRQGGQDGFVVEGQRKNNEFVASISDFPLELFNLSPGREYGILGPIEGDVNAELAINLLDFTGAGKLNINQPAIGNIQATEIAGNFNYYDNQAQLEQGYLKFLETEYNLQGGVNFATGEINGKLNLEGEMDDIFKTLKISDINTIAALINNFQNKDTFSSANNIQSASIGDNNNSIREQLNLLYNVEQSIKKIAKEIEAGTIPNELEIIGEYEGEINIAGTIKSPQVSLNFEGNEWQWLPQQSFPNIVQSLGLVMEETQSIAIPKVLVKANYQNQKINVDKFNLNIGKSKINFAGNLGLNEQKGEFAVENFSLDLVENFVPLPVDIGGEINIKGKVGGNLLVNPEVEGNISILNAALDGQILEKDIEAKFNYSNYTLNFDTTFPEEIKVAATIPYHPLIDTNQPTNINVQLDTEAIALLGVLSQGQIELSGGEAEANVNVEIASLTNLIDDLSQKNPSLEKISDEIKLTGDVLLDDAKITSVALSKPLNLTGKVTLLDETKAIQVEQINASYNDTVINIAGVLPLLKPIKNNPNPLTVSIPEQNLNLDELYSGNIDGDIQIVGTALTPEIGGYVSLNNGRVGLIAQSSFEKVENTQLWYRWLGDISRETAGNFKVKLNDFEVKLGDLQFAQWGLYRFSFGGDLTVNGNLLDIDNLRADGAVNLNRGQIYLGGVTSRGTGVTPTGSNQTTFYLSRTNNNQISFNPNDSILNPRINVEVQADITDYSRQLAESQRNEIPEPIIRSGRGETIRVTLGIDGRAQQLLPSLAGDGSQFCNIRSDNPIAEEVQLSNEQLTSVAQCVNIAALQEEGSNLGLLNSPLVQISSTPNRSEGELINLIIGGQLINIANQLQNLSGEQLFESGFVQFILVPLANNFGFAANETVSTWGQPVGMKDFRIFPAVEGVYELQEKTNITVSYDYIYSEFKVRYQMRF